MHETTLVQQQAPGRLGQFVDWFKSRERPILIVGAIAQVAVLAGMIGLRTVPFVGGKTVLLEVWRPVDPRDMFRGHYVILSYKFSRVPDRAANGMMVAINGVPANSADGKTVYVSLVPDKDGIHCRTGDFSPTRPDSGVFLRGTVAGWNQIEFGLERCYIQEGTEDKYVSAMREHRLWAEVTIAPDGQATLKSLKVE